MEKTVEYTVNNRVSPATIELLIREGSKEYKNKAEYSAKGAS